MIHWNCGGVGRRDFLRVGALGLGGLSVPQFLASQKKPKDKALIFLWLAGGPSHLDTYDLKPDAPAEYRGEFKPIPTSVPGIRICELLPHTARQADKLCILRSVTSADFGSHERSTRYLQTGVLPAPDVDFASYGSVCVKEKNPQGAMPPYVGILKPVHCGCGAGFLGTRYDPLIVGDPSAKNFTVRHLALPQGIPEAHKAFDISQEPEKIRDAYGRTPVGQGLLLARRLVEHGVKAVSVWMGGWDTHTSNFKALKERQLPALDRGYGALIADLAARGLLDSTLVVQMGEFGRTPKINESGGRDHWPKAFSVVLAGGGIQGGQVIGATDKHGAEVTEHPITVEDLSATIFTALGVDIRGANHTPEGRPVAVVSGGKPVAPAFA